MDVIRFSKLSFVIFWGLAHAYCLADTPTMGPLTQASEHKITKPKTTKKQVHQEVDWDFFLLMAADNNLSYFAWNNIKQISQIGSNKNVRIIVQINEPGSNKKTQRFLIKKNSAKPLLFDPFIADKKMDTGDPNTLINFVVETFKVYPAKHIFCDLWDHGFGYLDPAKAKTFGFPELFQLNPSDMMLERNQLNDAFANYINTQQEVRGICFDETHNSYLSNKALEYAFKTICTKLGRKIDVIGTDACLMQMLEFASLLSPYAHYMVGSQEIELGAGWNYKYILEPFLTKTLTPAELSKHIVQSYQRVYSRITHEYTLSAVDLTLVGALEQNVNNVGLLLRQCVAKQIDNSVKSTLMQCRNRNICQCFDIPDYVDLANLYQNILKNISRFKIKDDQTILNQLETELSNGLQYLRACVIENTVGKNVKNANGLSIYFPERSIHSSYLHAPFQVKNNWVNLLVALH